MRSERKKGRALLARFMVLLMIINLLSGINPSAVRADNATDGYYRNGNEKQENGVTISKKVTDYNAADGTYDIELKVKGGTEIVQNNIPLDVVLVMDTSGSMRGSALVNAKKAANNFVDKLLSKNKNVNIGIVSFAEKGEIKSNLTNNVTALKNAIDGLKAGGGTYTQQGIEKAAGILNKVSGNHKKVMVVVGDGEPTLANGEHPNFDNGGFYRIYDPATKKEGYEQWYGNAFKWLGKGYNSAHRNYLVKLINGGFGNGTKEREGWGHVSWPFNLMDDYFEKATLKAADTIKNNTEIITVGIGLENNNLAKSIMNKLATSGSYLEAGDVAGKLDKILDDLAEKLQKKVSEGVITDNMSQFVDCFTSSIKLSGTVGNAECKISDKSITVKNITLGEGEELTLSYKVKLKDSWKDGEFHPANGKTTLLPTENGQEIEFNVPKIRADKATISIVVNKKWIGNKVPEGVNEVKFNIAPEVPNMNNTITVKENEKWSGTLNALPKYKDGKKIEYKVTEVAGNKYKIVGNIEKNIADNGDLVFTATNKNTEKVTFIVKKEWGTTPSELQFPARVQLYANNKKVKLEAFSNNVVTFTGLDKFDATGNEIKYTVKEVNEANAEEKDGKITNNGFDYTVNHKDGAYDSTITNTCTNPQAREFTATITKKWKGGIGKEVTFLFDEKDGGNYGEIKLERKDNKGDTWTGKINLAKYNDEGKELTYVVTEKKIAGFTSDNTKGIEISAANANATFINTRNTKNITVTKIWKDTPDSLKTDVEVVLYENGNKSNRNDAIKKITKNGNGTVEYTGLPVTDEDGNEIAYTVKENNFNSILFNSEVKADTNGDFVITNTYTKLKEDTISVTLVKEWLGGVGHNATFKFTNAVTGEVVKELTLTAETEGVTVETLNGGAGKTWEITVSDLRKYDNNAEPIQYKVSEVIDNKAFELQSGNDVAFNGGGTVKFTNTRVMKELTLNKKWAGPAAEKAVFKITPSDKKVELNNSNSWKDTIALPVYDLDGNVIEYTVTEEEVEGYKAKEKEQKFSFVDPTGQPDNRELTFINVKYTDEAQSTFTINKTWKSDFKQTVAFGLFDDLGNKIGNIIKLTSNNALQGTDDLWSYSLTKDSLPEYREDSSKIRYEIKEMDGLDDNAKPIENDEITIGNRTYEVERRFDGNTYNFINKDITTGNVKATKIWEGTPSADAKFGLFKKETNDKIDVAPEVETKDDGKVVVMTFKDLHFADADGKAIEYEVREMNAAGDILDNGDVLTIGNKEYKVSYKEGNDGVIITNTELIKITVEKVWGENVPEIAKREIKFRVLGGYLTGGTLSAENNWTWTSGYLPLYDIDNNKISYSVVETEINGEKIDLNQGLVTDEDGKTVYYHKAFKITLDGANDITESKTVKITNSIREAEHPTDPNNRIIHVVKDWTVNAKKENVTVKLYKLDTAKGEIVAVEGKEVKLTEADKWTAEFEVPKAENNEEIIYYAFETAIGDDKVDESELSPNLYNDGYQIGEYNVTITELTSDTENAEFGNYGFYILNESNNNPVQPEEKVTINVTKQWAIPTTSEYVKPVKVRLFVENGEYLVPVFGADDLTLSTENNWAGKFDNLDKTDYDGNKINYHVAEVGIEGEQDKEIISLSDMLNVNGYTIGKYHVVIDGDGTENVVITNDVKLIDVKAVKNWSGIVPRRAVQFTLYSSHDNIFDSTGKVATLDGTDNELVATFNNLPALDSNGKPIVYYVFETKIGDADSTFTALAEATTSYSVNVTGGRYDVVVNDNGTVGDKVVIIQNSYVPNSNDPVVPPIPGFDPTPTPTPIPDPTPDTTPTVDIPDDTTPQGDANINTDEAEEAEEDEENDEDVDDTDDDDILEVDNDDVPQGDAKIEDAIAEDPIDIDGDPTPRGPANLPQTGGTASDFLSLIGMGLIGLGLVVKKRK